MRETGRRNQRLDALRGVAILAVIVEHGYVESFGHSTIGVPFFGAAWAGVDLFFILSGYFIGGQLLREQQNTGSIALGRFWLRRGLRIWPAYIAVFGCYTLLPIQAALRHHAWTNSAADAIRVIPYNLFFIQNYVPDMAWPSTWTLAVEEHFYIGLPLILLAWRRLRTPLTMRGASIVMICVILAETAMRAMNVAGIGFRSEEFWATHLRLDDLAAGVWLALFLEKSDRGSRLARRVSPLTVALIVAIAALYTSATPLRDISQTDALRYPLLTGALGLWVAITAAREDGSVGSPISRTLAWVGRYSYCMYLTQAVVRDVPHYDAVRVATAAIFGRASGFFLFLAATVVTAVLLSHLIEQPLLLLRERIVPPQPMRSPAPEIDAIGVPG